MVFYTWALELKTHGVLYELYHTSGLNNKTTLQGYFQNGNSGSGKKKGNDCRQELSSGRTAWRPTGGTTAVPESVPV